ncbi:uncharacterized protein LOC130690383 isoform X2 [Daphnia carinata]|uniref:uncharacterized protein LOC130690383 isoform X2 n=1 Tax=Daphnia carinata TaxID=120202 RepID=UPI002868A70B|nr:uncharacterized protein LOC130690383 isoform X2 [Daphnia carinata]
MTLLPFSESQQIRGNVLIKRGSVCFQVTFICDTQFKFHEQSWATGLLHINLDDSSFCSHIRKGNPIIWNLLAMDNRHQLVLLATCFLIIIASGARETFSQRRQRLLEEKRRQQLNSSNSIVTATTTPAPIQLASSINEAVAASNEVAFEIEMNTGLNWEQYLIPIPSSMGILATMMMAAGQTDDFPLNEHVPSGGFRYMKHSDSFRRSLLQIGHESYRAFLCAHNNMNKIRLSTLTIPAYIKAAIDILGTGDVQLIQLRLHRPLSVVMKSINDNVNWSEEVSIAFGRLSNLTDEVHLAAVSSYNVKSARTLQLSAKQSTSQLTADLLQQSLKNLEERVTKDLDGFDRGLKDLQEAQLSVPTAMESFGMNVKHFVFNVVLGSAMKLVTTMLGGRNRFGSSSHGESSIQQENDTAISPPDPCIYDHYLPTFKIFAKSLTLLNEYQTLLSINSAKGSYNKTQDMAEYKNFLNITSQCGPIREVIETGLETIDQLHQLANTTKMPDGLEQTEVTNKESRFEEWRKKEFERVRKLMESFNEEAKYLRNVALRVPAYDIRSGNVTRPGEKFWTGEQAKANAYYKVALHEEKLEVLRRSLNGHWKQIISKTDESIRVLKEIHTWKAEELGLEQAVKMLEAGMTEMSSLKKNWSLLVRCFIQLSQIIKTISDSNVEHFVNHLETTIGTESFKRGNGQLKSWVIQAIQEKTVKANQAMSLVHDMAATYTGISTKYLMPRVHTLDQMMNFQETNSTVMFYKRNQLIESCIDDQLKIQQLIEEEKLRMREKVESRGRQIRQQYAMIYQLEEDNVNNGPSDDSALILDINVDDF